MFIKSVPLVMCKTGLKWPVFLFSRISCLYMLKYQLHRYLLTIAQKVSFGTCTCLRMFAEKTKMKRNFERLEYWRYPETVSFRTTTSEAKMISQMATQRNLTRSEFLRNAIQTLMRNENNEGKNR